VVCKRGFDIFKVLRTTFASLPNFDGCGFLICSVTALMTASLAMSVDGRNVHAGVHLLVLKAEFMISKS
jgi:hypothetical protein